MVVLPRLFVFEVWRNVRLDIGGIDVAIVVVDVWELGFMKSARGWELDVVVFLNISRLSGGISEIIKR